MRYPIAWAVIVMVVLGCAGIGGLPDRSVKRRVSRSEVVGVWKMTDASRKLLTDDGDAPDPNHRHTITFRDDGTLRFRSVVDGFRGGNYHDATGTWKLVHGADPNEPANRLRPALDLAGTSYHFAFEFTEDDGPLRLWTYYGDPDSWEFIEYERTAAPNDPNPSCPGLVALEG